VASSLFVLVHDCVNDNYEVYLFLALMSTKVYRLHVDVNKVVDNVGLDSAFAAVSPMCRH